MEGPSSRIAFSPCLPKVPVAVHSCLQICESQLVHQFYSTPLLVLPPTSRKTDSHLQRILTPRWGYPRLRPARRAHGRHAPGVSAEFLLLAPLLAPKIHALAPHPCRAGAAPALPGPPVSRAWLPLKRNVTADARSVGLKTVIEATTAAEWAENAVHAAIGKNAEHRRCAQCTHHLGHELRIAGRCLLRRWSLLLHLWSLCPLCLRLLNRSRLHRRVTVLSSDIALLLRLRIARLTAVRLSDGVHLLRRRLLLHHRRLHGTVTGVDLLHGIMCASVGEPARDVYLSHALQRFFALVRLS